MASGDLSQFSLVLATVGGVVLGLYLAAAAMLFQLVVTQSGETAQLAIANVTASGRLIDRAVRLGRFRSLFPIESGHDTYDEYLILIEYVLAEPYHPRTFDAGKFRDAYNKVYEPVAEQIHSGARATFLQDPQSGIELNRLSSEFSAMWGQFASKFNLYTDTLGVWSQLRKDLIWLGLGAAYVGITLLIAAAATTSQPSIGEHLTLNLAVGLLMLALGGLGVVWPCRRVYQLARTF